MHVVAGRTNQDILSMLEYSGIIVYYFSLILQYQLNQALGGNDVSLHDRPV